MKARDGKYYLTDVGDQETILKIVELVSSDSVPYFERWFDSLDNFTEKKVIKIVPAKELDKLSHDHQEGTYPQFEDGDSENTDEEFMLMVDGYCENNIITIKAFVAG